MRFRFGFFGFIKVEDLLLKVNIFMFFGEMIWKLGCFVNLCLCLKEIEGFEDFDVYVFNNEWDLFMVFYELMVIF